MPLNAGALDRRITLLTATATQSASGEETFDWAHAAAVPLWAGWVPANSRELYLSRVEDDDPNRQRSYIDGAYKIYYRDEPKPDRCRIVGHDGRTYDLKPAIELERRAGWLIPVVARGED